MIDAVICFTTTSSEKEAKKLAQGLVRKRLAACAQIVPKITSVYEWDGAIHEDSELLIIIKASADRLDEIKDFIEDNHSYEVPELVALDIADGLPAYLDWLHEMSS